VEFGQRSPGNYNLSCFCVHGFYGVIYKKAFASLPCWRTGKNGFSVGTLLYFDLTDL
jgi:hypothetical protein